MRIVAIIALVSMTLGCGAPMGPIAGGALQGHEKAWPTDWSFTDEVENVLLETNPMDPHSVTVWGVYVGENFYVAGASHKSEWVHNILKNGDIRLVVKSSLFTGRASRTIDLAELRAVGDAYTAKYEIDTGEDSTFIEDGGIIFRLSPR